ncbi:MAG: hypothetical protein K8S23_13725 [Candidatus Cloacimonetes bacterium]|nr:hypothetical protein [Candidatus Cloacimonadota bacterium]
MKYKNNSSSNQNSFQVSNIIPYCEIESLSAISYNGKWKKENGEMEKWKTLKRLLPADFLQISLFNG